MSEPTHDLCPHRIGQADCWYCERNRLRSQLTAAEAERDEARTKLERAELWDYELWVHLSDHVRQHTDDCEHCATAEVDCADCLKVLTGWLESLDKDGDYAHPPPEPHTISELRTALAAARSALERAEKRAEDAEDWVNKLSTQVRFAEAERDEWKKGWENMESSYSVAQGALAAAESDLATTRSALERERSEAGLHDLHQRWLAFTTSPECVTGTPSWINLDDANRIVREWLAALDREGERPTPTEWVDVGTHDDPYFVEIPAPTDREGGPTDG